MHIRPQRPLVAALALTVMILAGCSSTQPEPAPPTEAPAEPAAATNDNEQSFLDALAAIDPAMVTDDDALDYAENVCLDIEQGKDEATLTRNAALRFEVEEAEVGPIIAAVREHLCP